MQLTPWPALRRLLLSLLVGITTVPSWAQLPANYLPPTDWLLAPSSFVASSDFDSSSQALTLSNGLIARTWSIQQTAITTSYRNLMTGEELLRAIRPEVVFEIDGSAFEIGSSAKQANHAYLSPEFLAILNSDSSKWQLTTIDVDSPKERFPWKRTRHHAPNAHWPPKGSSVHFHYDYIDQKTIPLSVTVHYEMFDGIPALSKWITFRNNGQEAINLDTYKAEILAVTPYEDPVEFREGVSISPPNIHVETDFAFGGFSVKNSQRNSVHWVPDPEWKSQVNWARQTPSLLEVRPSLGPDQTITTNNSFDTFRIFELIYDTTERERKGLALRRLYRTVAPWVTENPLILHVVSTNEDIVKNAIDQAAECGFEMLSLSFGSGLNMEDDSVENHEKFRQLSAYAEEKQIHLGGYSLLSSRRIKPDSDNIVNSETGKPGGQTHGYCPALASDWGQNYFRQLNNFFDNTGFLQFTHDGSYPGDIDAAARLPLQKGANDSQWVQWKIITKFYQKLRAEGAYVRVPDYYFLSGVNECGMGYREVNWSLPRLQQQLHTRQNIYDGTWEKTPSMGWMFVPLTQYHGGGEAATIEPLHQNLSHYETMIASNLGAGVQAVYRGHRLYDTEETKAAVIRWVSWFKSNRNILESDIIHSSSRRANSREPDWFFHANPALETKGFLVVYNPLNHQTELTLPLNLYYTSLSDSVLVSIDDGPSLRYPLNERKQLKLPLKLNANEIRSVSFSEVKE